MPDVSKKPWSDIVAFLAGDGGVVIQVILIVGVAYLALRASTIFVHGVVKALLDREVSEGTAQELSAAEVMKRIATLDALARNVLRFFILVIASITVLGTLDVNIAPAIAGLGIVGVALGFGAQEIVKDYLTGALILVENQYSKGDIVRVAGVSGVVEDFSLRRTTLRDLDGVVHTIPNGRVTVASNMTRSWSRVNLDVKIAYGTDVDLATAVMNEVGNDMAADPAWRRRILEAPQVLRVEDLGESGVTIKILGSVRASEQWAVAGELRKRLLAAFAERGIEIPFPHRVVITRREGATDREGDPDAGEWSSGSEPGGGHADGAASEGG